MMEAVRTSETSVYSETSRCYIAEDSNLRSGILFLLCESKTYVGCVLTFVVGFVNTHFPKRVTSVYVWTCF
jgi:membrane protein YqaA with SNARE-associated domain